MRAQILRNDGEYEIIGYFNMRNELIKVIKVKIYT